MQLQGIRTRSLKVTSSVKMSEKLCLQWNDFMDNVNSAFRRLRGDKEFTDVTLVCDDGQQMEAHKAILASSSPFLEKILQKSRHPHPLIYLKGFQSKDFAAILDFLYFGEANVYQEDLDSFLAIAEEMKLNGLTEQTSNEVMLEEQEKPGNSEAAMMEKDLITTLTTDQRELIRSNIEPQGKLSKELVVQNQSGTNLQALDEKVKSMMEKGQKMIPCGGKLASGTRKHTRSSICKACGKEGLAHHIKDHIESNHLEGISISCDYCGNIASSRASLAMHKSKHHK